MDAWGDLKSKAFLGDEEAYRTRLLEQVGELPSVHLENSDSDGESACSSLEIFFSAITNHNELDADAASIGTSTECGSLAGQMDGSIVLAEGLDETTTLMEYKTDQNDPRTINLPNKGEDKQNSGHCENKAATKGKLEKPENPATTVTQPPDTKEVWKHPSRQKTSSACTTVICKASTAAEDSLTQGASPELSSPERKVSTTADFVGQTDARALPKNISVTKGSLGGSGSSGFGPFDKYGFGGLTLKDSGSRARGLGAAETAACLNFGEGVAKIFDNLGFDDLLDQL